MILLSKAQEILLMQFPEQRGERLGAQVGQTLPEDHFRETERISPGVEFEGALEGLVAHGLMEKVGEEYKLTQTGYDYLYAGAGHRTGVEVVVAGLGELVLLADLLHQAVGEDRKSVV